MFGLANQLLEHLAIVIIGGFRIHMFACGVRVLLGLPAPIDTSEAPLSTNRTTDRLATHDIAISRTKAAW